MTLKGLVLGVKEEFVLLTHLLITMSRPPGALSELKKCQDVEQNPIKSSAGRKTSKHGKSPGWPTSGNFLEAKPLTVNLCLPLCRQTKRKPLAECFLRVTAYTPEDARTHKPEERMRLLLAAHRIRIYFWRLCTETAFYLYALRTLEQVGGARAGWRSTA